MTQVNAAVYSRVKEAPAPVSLAVMKVYLKITAAADDALIQSMIDASTQWCEKYTGRDFRAITWLLLIDCFTDRINIRRNPVASIGSVQHLVDGNLVTVDSSTYYLKKLTQSAQILLNNGEEWPTNTDDREQAIQITFTSSGVQCQDSAILAVQRMVAFWYRNRGDCCDASEAGVKSGVTGILNQFRIARV